jgi:hypothetical protein
LGFIAGIIISGVGSQLAAAARCEREAAELRRESKLAVEALDHSHGQSDRDSSRVGDYDTPATLRRQPNANWFTTERIGRPKKRR